MASSESDEADLIELWRENPCLYDITALSTFASSYAKWCLLPIPEPNYSMPPVHHVSQSTALSKKISYCPFYGVSTISIYSTKRSLSFFAYRDKPPCFLFMFTYVCIVARYAAIGQWIKLGHDWSVAVFRVITAPDQTQLDSTQS